MLRVLRLVQPRRMRGLLRLVRNAAPGVFLRELLSQPAALGCICPSSRFLARGMAQEVPLDVDGMVIELGAGTGAITRALLQRGIAPRDLLLIENSPAFVQRLRDQFPGVTVVHGNAADLYRLIPPGRPVRAIVSSLPLCSLPASLTAAILSQWPTLLQPDGIAVQFTYHLRKPAWRKHLEQADACSRIVWANLPPANISTFSFGAHAPEQAQP